MHQIGLNEISGPGIKEGGGKWMNTQSGRSTKPISPGGGREGTKRSRRFGPSIITPNPRKTAHSYPSEMKYLFGTKIYVKTTICRGRDLRTSSLLLRREGEGQTLPRRQQGTYTLLSNLTTHRHPSQTQHQFPGKKQFTSVLGRYCPYLPQAVALGPRFAPPAVRDRQRCLPVRH